MMTDTANNPNEALIRTLVTVIRAAKPADYGKNLVAQYGALDDDENLKNAGHTAFTLFALALNDTAADAIRKAYEAQVQADIANREAARLIEQAQQIRAKEELTDKLAAKGLKPCPRCGGAGGSKHWPDFTCYKCNGAGALPLSGSRA